MAHHPQFFLGHEVLRISSIRDYLVLELHGCHTSRDIFATQRLVPLFPLGGWFRRDGRGNRLRAEDVREERLEHAGIEDVADPLPTSVQFVRAAAATYTGVAAGAGAACGAAALNAMM